MSIQLFSSNFYFLIYFLLMLVLSLLFMAVVISLPSGLFIYSFRSWINSILNADKFSSFFFFDTCSQWTSSLRYKTLYIVISFFFSDPFVEILLSFILKMVPSILGGEQPRYLSLWWDFCYVVWFQTVFLFSWGHLFIFFFFHVLMFDGFRFQYCQVFGSSFFTETSYSFLI